MPRRVRMAALYLSFTVALLPLLSRELMRLLKHANTHTRCNQTRFLQLEARVDKAHAICTHVLVRTTGAQTVDIIVQQCDNVT